MFFMAVIFSIDNLDVYKLFVPHVNVDTAQRHYNLPNVSLKRKREPGEREEALVTKKYTHNCWIVLFFVIIHGMIKTNRSCPHL